MSRALRACCVVALIIGVEATVDGQSPPRRGSDDRAAGGGCGEPAARVRRRRAAAGLGAAEGRHGVAARAARRRVLPRLCRARAVPPRHDDCRYRPTAGRARWCLPTPRALTRVTLQVRAVELMAFVEPRSCARAVRVDRSQSRRRQLRRSAGAVGRRVLHRARTDRRAWLSPQSRRRPELPRAVSVARAPAVGDAGGRAGDSALPARSRSTRPISRGCSG